MANADSAFGFRPLNKNGYPYSGGTQRCAIIATDATAVFIGDAVALDGSASTVYPNVTQAASTLGIVYGVVTSFEANPDSLSDQYRKASTLRYCQVCSVLDQDFECQANGADASLAASSVGANVDFVVGTGSTAYGTSAMELNAATEATTTALDLTLVRPVDRPDNDVTLANANWIVRFNTPTTAQQVAGVVGI